VTCSLICTQSESSAESSAVRPNCFSNTEHHTHAFPRFDFLILQCQSRAKGSGDCCNLLGPDNRQEMCKCNKSLFYWKGIQLLPKRGADHRGGAPHQICTEITMGEMQLLSSYMLAVLFYKPTCKQ
ncbi:hypothetical protein PDJAM_G00213950, partial [Pangasius djambal]|nr:hypothetical protein [Pangasius djambal]